MLRKYKNGQWEQFASRNSSRSCQGLSKGFHYPIITINVPVVYMGSTEWIRDGKKSDPGSGINIPDPSHCLFL